MTDEQKAAYVIAQAACLMATVAGMQAENQHRMNCGNSIAYGEEAFQRAIDESYCTHNAVLALFHH